MLAVLIIQALLFLMPLLPLIVVVDVMLLLLLVVMTAIAINRELVFLQHKRVMEMVVTMPMDVRVVMNLHPFAIFCHYRVDRFVDIG